NLDLLAELVLCSELLGERDDAFVATALACAADAQSAAGGVPQRAGAGAPDDPDACYHPTLMWSYAAALAERGR
ncbi:MAG TPA: hypothetical protein VK665_14670, partial [Candidatus Elarobacter sp.]|nr:hypothetical protein [Candidatus Elarobacter sp.]